MLHFMVTLLISLVLCRVKVSLTMTPFGSFADSVVDRTMLTFLGSGSPIVMLPIFTQAKFSSCPAHLVVRKRSRLILLQTTIRDQVSTASSVACLRVWGRLPDGWTSLTMPSSKRQPHLEVLFVPGQVVWMRLGWPGPGKAKSS